MPAAHDNNEDRFAKRTASASPTPSQEHPLSLRPVRHRLPFKPAPPSVVCSAIALAVLVACNNGDARPSTAQHDTPPRTDSSAILRNQMVATDDSLNRLLVQLDSGGSTLGQLDSARRGVELDLARRGEVNERLEKSAPNVYARLASFVAEHKRLRLRLVALDDTISQLRRRVAQLEARNASLRATVSSLRTANEELRGTIAKLVADSTERARKLVQLDSSRRAILDRTSQAYVAIATKDSLTRLGLVGKTNFLHLGRDVLKNVDARALRRVDTRTDTVFAVSAPPDRTKVLTSHPAGSFMIIDEGGASRLRVVDVDAFWSTSRVLAVMIDR
jgi:hypothetical protein